MSMLPRLLKFCDLQSKFTGQDQIEQYPGHDHKFLVSAKRDCQRMRDEMKQIDQMTRSTRYTKWT